MMEMTEQRFAKFKENSDRAEKATGILPLAAEGWEKVTVLLMDERDRFIALIKFCATLKGKEWFFGQYLLAKAVADEPEKRLSPEIYKLIVKAVTYEDGSFDSNQFEEIAMEVQRLAFERMAIDD